MKLSLGAIVLTFVVAVLSPTNVCADRMVRVLFNNGFNESDSGSCNTTDDILINTIFTLSGYNATYGRRNLRSMNDHHDEQQERELQLWPPKCKANCAGWAPTKCRATDCVGYRRQLGAAKSPTNQRELSSGKAFSCTTQVNYLHAELNKLVTNNLVSSSCQTLLSKPRNVTCYDDVIYGVVEYFKLWTTDTAPPTVVNSDYVGQDICKSARVNFEAIANACVDFMLVSVKGPKNYYAERGEYTLPFTVYGDNITVGGTLWGVKLPSLGRYELMALPDGLVEKAKNMTFNIVTGPVESIKLWDTAAKTIMNSSFTGGNICRNQEFNFEIVVSPCADSLKAVVTGPSGYLFNRTEYTRPFTAFGDLNGVIFGRKLSTVGEYTLTVYPDQVITDKVAIIKFNITNC
jgi:hypothetical protein